ncbi:Transposase, Mutator family [Streptomyces sp. DvalAA-43]|nr:Transposase, Mutator family [Streptomyces sp. DvalAA-43]
MQVADANTWGGKYPAIARLWENAWEEFTPFLRFDTEIRRIVCTTNAIESVNARIRRAVKARGHFPDEQAALKCVYMAIMSLDPTGKGQTRWKQLLWGRAGEAQEPSGDVAQGLPGPHQCGLWAEWLDQLHACGRG